MYDVVVIGGGINGCGVARDAAGRGLKVLLLEKGDLANGTSCASTKLVHGGLRYLEHYEFQLVRESLLEREVLWGMAPHIIWPLRFVLPHHGGLRPAWLIRLGLFLYDHIGGRKLLPGCNTLNLTRDAAGAPLQNKYKKAFEYSDCWVDDARLVVLNAMDARDRGADVKVGCEMTAAERDGDTWTLTYRDHGHGDEKGVTARAVVNAGGPWVGDILTRRIRQNRSAKVRLVKGSHIVVPRHFEHDRAYIFQNSDKRIVFAIPYEDDFTLIGTTDVDFSGDPDDVAISEAEVDYLCSAVSGYFKKEVSPKNVVWTYSGIRPLYDDGTQAAQKATRDYVLDLDHPAGQAPLLNVFGGKITTYRRLSEEVMDKTAPALPQAGPAWTAGAGLPGGDFPVTERADVLRQLTEAYPGLPAPMLRRLVRSYGTRSFQILEGVSTIQDLGRDFGAGLYEREVAYLIEHEWTRTAEDVIWRRSKLGLRLSQPQIDGLAQWMTKRNAKVSPSAA